MNINESKSEIEVVLCGVEWRCDARLKDVLG